MESPHCSGRTRMEHTSSAPFQMLPSCPEGPQTSALPATAAHPQGRTACPARNPRPQSHLLPCFPSLQPLAQSPQPAPLSPDPGRLQVQEIRTSPDHKFLFGGDRSQRKPPPLQSWKRELGHQAPQLRAPDSRGPPSGWAPSAATGTLRWGPRVTQAGGVNPSGR